MQRHGNSQQYGVLGEVAARALGTDLGQPGRRKAGVRDTRYEASVMIQAGDDNTPQSGGRILKCLNSPVFSFLQYSQTKEP